MRVLIDTNVLLDVLLSREPWAGRSKAVWDAADAGRFDAFISALSLPNVFYIGRKLAGLEKAHAAVTTLLDAFEILPVDRPTLEAAAALPGNDFEDNVQLASALASGMDAVVTRDPSGFKSPDLLRLTPEELLARLAP